MHHVLTNERGIVLIFVALGLLLLMLFLGVATDTGVLVYTRTQSQTRVDAAALAAAAALNQTTAGARQSTATSLANTFSAKNAVVTATTNPVSIVEPMSYNPTTEALTTAPDWSPGATGQNCNAVRISTTVPSAQFFSGFHGVFGSGGSAAVDITVSAVGHLPCPGQVQTDTAQWIGPIALRQCRWTFPQDCDSTRRLFQQSQQVDNTVSP